MRAYFSFIPRPIRLAVFVAAVGVILYLSLAPQKDIPVAAMFWDKFEHAAAYTILTFIGLVLSTHRRWMVALAVWIMGVGIEFIQAMMGLGRQGDWHDVVANSIGIVIGLAIWAILRRFKPKAPPLP